MSWKIPARVATTGNITLSGEQTIDGISVVDGDRVLVKNQTIPSQNGCYTVSTGAWTRAYDMNTSTEAVSGTSIYVSEGTANATTVWVQVTPNPISLGTTDLIFAKLFNTDGLEELSNKVTGFSSPTDTQYPSAKLVKDQLDLKANTAHTHVISDTTNLQTTLDAKVDDTTTVNGKALSANITLDKTDVGLGNVDNTSDSTKWSQIATLDNKTIDGGVF